MLTISTKYRECEVVGVRGLSDGGVDISFRDICFTGFKLSAMNRFKLEKQGFLLIWDGASSSYLLRLS